jgi:hypothetical protein
MRKRILIPVLIAGVSLGSVATARALGILPAGGLVLVTLLASLAIYRLILTHYDHVLRAAGANPKHPLRRWFHHREHQVDHAGIVLTVCCFVFALAMAAILASQLIDTALRKVMTPFSLR